MTKKEILNLIDTYAKDYNRQTRIAYAKLNDLTKHNGSETEIEWANVERLKAWGGEVAMMNLKHTIEQRESNEEEMNEFRAHLGKY